jgi:hypothetical protein
MLNTQHFILLAGDCGAYDQELLDNVPTIGLFQSKSLTKLQEEQSARGRLSAQLVLSIYGWTVRYASGLQGFGILRRADSFNPASALEWGRNWVEQDPQNRELFVSKADVRWCEGEGHDCSLLVAKQ